MTYFKASVNDSKIESVNQKINKICHKICQANNPSKIIGWIQQYEAGLQVQNRNIDKQKQPDHKMSVSSSTMGGGRTKYKVILLGDQSVGKSSIIEKYIKDKFQQGFNPTVGIDFHIKNVTRNGKHYRIQLWDTAGQERFRSLIPNYMKDAHCAILVYDSSKPKTLANLKVWNDMFEDNKCAQSIKVFVGNKIDLEEKCVTKKQGQQEAQKYDATHFEVSAKTGKNIQTLFHSIIDMILSHIEEKTKLPVVNDEEEEKGDDVKQQQIKQVEQKIEAKKITLKKQTEDGGQDNKDRNKTKKKESCC